MSDNTLIWWILILLFLFWDNDANAGEKFVDVGVGYTVGHNPKVDLIGMRSRVYRIPKAKTMSISVYKWCIDGYVWYETGDGDMSQAMIAASKMNPYDHMLIRCENAGN